MKCQMNSKMRDGMANLALSAKNKSPPNEVEQMECGEDYRESSWLQNAEIKLTSIAGKVAS